jgi:hypothetical protein
MLWFVIVGKNDTSIGQFELFAHVPPLLAVVREETGDETDRPGE